jgi:hypothetical protein
VRASSNPSHPTVDFGDEVDKRQGGCEVHGASSLREEKWHGGEKGGDDGGPCFLYPAQRRGAAGDRYGVMPHGGEMGRGPRPDRQAAVGRQWPGHISRGRCTTHGSRGGRGCPVRRGPDGPIAVGQSEGIVTFLFIQIIFK